MNASYVSGLPQLLCLAVSIAAGLIAAVSYRRRQRPAALATMRRGAAPGKILYNDAPTVRVVDPQRVDRMRKVIRLAAGEHIDVLETRPGLPARFRIALKGIARHGGLDAAQIAVEFGGTHVSCGPKVAETGFNEFLVPRAMRDEPRSAVFHYHDNGSSLDFMRIKVRAVDVAAAVAELDILQVSGSWPVGDGE